MDISELKDSRELMEATPHHFFLIFTVLVTATMIGALIWMHFSSMDVYVKATGIVRPSEAISSIRSIAGGKLKEVNIVDGQLVNQGDILYSFDQETLYLQLDADEVKKSEVYDEVRYLELYRESIERVENLLPEDTEKALRYRRLVDKYILERQIALQQIEEEKTNTNIGRETAGYSVTAAQQKIKTYKDELASLKNYRASIENSNALADSGTLSQGALDSIKLQSIQGNQYDSRLEKYISQLSLLFQNYQKVKTTASQTKQLYEAGAAPKLEADNAAAQADSAKAQMEDFKQAELLQTAQSISDYERNIESLNIELQKAQNEISSTYSAERLSPQLIMEQNKLSLLTQIDNEIMQNEQVIKQLETEINSINIQMKSLNVVAPVSGTINISAPLIPGDLLQAGAEVGNIVPQDSDSFKVSFMVNNKDIANVKEGQPMKLKVMALPYQEYGMIDGVVQTVSSDVRSSDGQAYLVEALIENKPIKSYKGRDETIKVGMLVEGRVISDTKTILRWAMEKLNFI
jgi:HlyD family secretion protein